MTVGGKLPVVIAFALGVISVALMALAATGTIGRSATVVFGATAGANLAVLACVWAILSVSLRLRTLLTGAFVGLVAALAFFLLLLLPIAIVSPTFEDDLREFVTTPAVFIDGGSIDLFLVVLAVVIAPLTEEPAKALGGLFAKPTTRRAAFLSGATAGAGFAIFENLGYSLAAASEASAWLEVMVLRSLSAALHPLATALVVLGVVEWRARRRRGALWVGLAAGVGVHALWNGTAVVLDMVQYGSDTGDLPGLTGVGSAVYTGALGIAMALVLLAAAREVRRRDPIWAPGTPPPPPLASEPMLERRAWTGLTIAAAIPIVTAAVVYPIVF